MKQAIKHFQRRHFWFLIAFKKIVLKKKSYLHKSGWIESIRRGKPCDMEGNQIPWMNFAVIQFFEQRLTSDLHLFEYGSGFSTQFFSRLVKQVTSVEYDEKWYNTVKGQLAENTEILYRAKDVDGKYCRTITEIDRAFDVVIVDGRDRVNCVKQSIPRLSASGVIILDDSEREKYDEATTYAKEHGFRALTLQGLKPQKVELNCSTILYRDNNCLGI